MSTSTATHVTSASDVRNAIGYGNTVRAYKRATLVASNEIPTTYGILNGCTVRTTLHVGKASTGRHSDYERITAAWVVVSLVNQNGWTVWSKGTRWTGPKAEADAMEAYEAAVAS